MKINVKVKPNSKKGPNIEELNNGSLVVYVCEIATDGKANEALIKILADYYKVPKTKIVIIRGCRSSLKTVSIKI